MNKALLNFHIQVRKATSADISKIARFANTDTLTKKLIGNKTGKNEDISHIRPLPISEGRLTAINENSGITVVECRDTVRPSVSKNSRGTSLYGYFIPLERQDQPEFHNQVCDVHLEMLQQLDKENGSTPGQYRQATFEIELIKEGKWIMESKWGWQQETMADNALLLLVKMAVKDIRGKVDFLLYPAMDKNEKLMDRLEGKQTLIGKGKIRNVLHEAGFCNRPLADDNEGNLVASVDVLHFLQERQAPRVIAPPERQQ